MAAAHQAPSTPAYPPNPREGNVVTPQAARPALLRRATQAGHKGEEKMREEKRRVQREEKAYKPGGKELERASPALAEDGHGSRLAGGLEERWAS